MNREISLAGRVEKDGQIMKKLETEEEELIPQDSEIVQKFVKNLKKLNNQKKEETDNIIDQLGNKNEMIKQNFEEELKQLKAELDELTKMMDDVRKNIARPELELEAIFSHTKQKETKEEVDNIQKLIEEGNFINLKSEILKKSKQTIEGAALNDKIAEEDINCACITSDCKYLFVATTKKILRITLEDDSKKVISTNSEDEIITMAYNDDKKHLYAISKQGNALIWKSETDKTSKIELKTKMLIAVISSSENRVISVNPEKKCVEIWDLDQKKLLKTIDNKGFPDISSLTATQDNQVIIWGTKDSLIKIWNFETQELEHCIDDAHAGEITALRVSKDNKLLYSGCVNGTINVWNLAKKKKIHSFQNAHERSIQGLENSNDGKFLFSASLDCTLKVWDVEAKIFLHKFENVDGNAKKLGQEAKKKELYSLILTEDNRYVIAAGEEGSLLLVNIGIRRETCIYKDAHKEAVIKDLKVTNDGRYAVSVANDNTVKLCSIFEKEEPIDVECNDEVSSIALSRGDKNNLIAIACDKKVIFWDLDERKMLQGFDKKHTQAITTMMFTKDGSKLLTCSNKGSFWTHRVESSSSISAYDSEMKNQDELCILAIDITSDDKVLISGSTNQSIDVWSLDKGEITSSIKNAHNGAIWSLKISHDDKTIVSGSTDGKIKAWNLETKSLAYIFHTSHLSSIKSLSISANSTLVMSSDSNSYLEVHNLQTRQRVYAHNELKGNMNSITAIAPGDDKRFIFSSNKGIHQFPNLFNNFGVQYSDDCSQFSIFRAMPLTSFLNSSDLEHRRNLIRSYPNLKVQPIGWNWFHIAAIFAPEKEIVQECIENNIPFTLDLLNKTPLHYLVPNERITNKKVTNKGNEENEENKENTVKEKAINRKMTTDWKRIFTNEENEKGTNSNVLACITLILTSFNKIIEGYQRQSELMGTLSDLLPFVIKLDDVCILNFLQHYVRIPEFPSGKTVDVFGRPKQGEISFATAKSMTCEPELVRSMVIPNQEGRMSIKVLPLKWDFSASSPYAKALILSLLNVTKQDIFEDEMITVLIRYLWKSTKQLYYFLVALFSLQAVLISVYAGLRESNLGLEIAIMVLAGFFLIYEAIEFILSPKKDYLSSLWNYCDIISNALVPTTLIFSWSGAEEDAKNWLFSFMLLFTYIKWVSYFRVFEQTRKLIQMIIQIIIDIKSFAFILALVVFGLSLIFSQFDRETTYPTHLFNSYRLLYSDFDLDNFSSPAMIFYFVIVIAFVAIVLLNMLITIMGQTFGAMEEKSVLVTSLDLLQLIKECRLMSRILSSMQSRKMNIGPESVEKSPHYLFYAEKLTEKKIDETKSFEILEDRVQALTKEVADLKLMLQPAESLSEGKSEDQQTLAGEIADLKATQQTLIEGFADLKTILLQFAKSNY